MREPSASAVAATRRINLGCGRRATRYNTGWVVYDREGGVIGWEPTEDQLDAYRGADRANRGVRQVRVR